MAVTPVYDIWRILTNPRDQVEREIRSWAHSAYLGDKEALCRVLGRYKFYVDTRDVGISSHLIMDGFWELWVTTAMMQCVRRGSVVADIGANMGYFTMLLADLVGPDGRVLAFEPNPDMTKLLRKTISCNGVGGYTQLHQIALGAESGQAELDVDVMAPGGACPVPLSKSHSVGRKAVMAASDYYANGKTAALPNQSSLHVVPMRRFDEIDGALDVEFIKIDVEGFEPYVWSGMTALLERNRPLTIFIEFTINRLDDPNAFLDEIESHGFSVEVIDGFTGVQAITRNDLFAQSHDINHMLALRRS
jgi:FkbM family methyltransferase